MQYIANSCKNRPHHTKCERVAPPLPFRGDDIFAIKSAVKTLGGSPTAACAVIAFGSHLRDVTDTALLSPLARSERIV